MLSLYFKCKMMMSLALPTFTILSLIVLLPLYMFITLSFALHVLGWE
jgi:hypothetical protein